MKVMYAIPNVFKFHKANAQPLLRGIVDALDMLSISHILPHVLRSTRQSARLLATQIQRRLELLSQAAKAKKQEAK